jgi:hypothetical protein
VNAPAEEIAETRPRGTLANLATIMVRPRSTMRRILDPPRDPMVLPLVFLAILSSFLSDYDLGALVVLLRNPPFPMFSLVIAGALLGTAVLAVGLFYLFAWLAAYVGRRLEGEANARQIRSALAWGLVPLIWALVFRAPVSLWFALGEPDAARPITIGSDLSISNAGLLSRGCGWALLIGAVEFTVFVWCVAAASLTVAEAHRFSGWQGLGTLALTVAIPLLILVSFALAAIF